MNRKTLAIAALAFFAAGASTAAGITGEATPDYPMAFSSSLTRAQVQQATLAARAAGQIVQGEQSVVVEHRGTALTRAQVRAETLEAIRIGAIAGGEHSVLPTAAQLDSIRMAGERALSMSVASR
jgi:hypothetical protein